MVKTIYKYSIVYDVDRGVHELVGPQNLYFTKKFYKAGRGGGAQYKFVNDQGDVDCVLDDKAINEITAGSGRCYQKRHVYSKVKPCALEDLEVAMVFKDESQKEFDSALSKLKKVKAGLIRSENLVELLGERSAR